MSAKSGILTTLALLVMAGLPTVAHATPVTFLETSCSGADAGDLDSPCLISGHPDQIAGDLEDFDGYAFHWHGGDFLVTATFIGDPAAIPVLDLFDYPSAGGVLFAHAYGTSLFVAGLAEGNYQLVLFLDYDPPYTLDFNFAIDPVVTDVPTNSEVPEPASLVLLGSGLLAASRKIRARRPARTS
jgi:hypothetical protein